MKYYQEKKLSVTYFRSNIYKLLDQVLETGQPIILERNGQTIIVQMKEQPNIFDRLKKQGLTSPDLSEDDLIYHKMGEYEEDPLLYKNDENDDINIAAEPNV